MCANLVPLLNDANRNFLSSVLRALLQSDCGAKAGGSSTNNDTVVLDTLSLNGCRKAGPSSFQRTSDSPDYRGSHGG
jgi:hypothetical protein